MRTWQYGVIVVLWPVLASSQPAPDAELYSDACAACHGGDGRGRPREEVGFSTPLPDFTDCSFASREPDPDWYAVIHQGGPIRAFDRMMPAFGEALSDPEIAAILRHVRTFCTDGTWPRGEFNVPRPLFTEKAYPEDEIVFTTTVDPSAGHAIEGEFLYEKRVGSTGMFEMAIPLSYQDGGPVSGAPHRTAPHRTAPHRTAPHRTAPHRTAPHRTAPHRTAPHRTAPHRTAPHRTAPHRTAPHRTAPHRTAPHRTAPHRTAPHRTAPHRTAPHRTAPHRTAPHRTAPHRTAPHRTAPHRTAPHRTAPHRTAPHRTAPHRTAPHRTAPHRTAPHRTAPAPSRPRPGGWGRRVRLQTHRPP